MINTRWWDKPHIWYLIVFSIAQQFGSISQQENNAHCVLFTLRSADSNRPASLPTCHHDNTRITLGSQWALSAIFRWHFYQQRQWVNKLFTPPYYRLSDRMSLCTHLYIFKSWVFHCKVLNSVGSQLSARSTVYWLACLELYVAFRNPMQPHNFYAVCWDTVMIQCWYNDITFTNHCKQKYQFQRWYTTSAVDLYRRGHLPASPRAYHN